MATMFILVIYAAFISLGLPDSLLGVTWPVMRTEFGMALGMGGVVSMTISGGTILSSLLSARAIHRFGVGRVTLVSVLMTAGALLGFSFAPSFWWLPLLAVPYGLGAGAVDSGLNEYVAEHYEARHMSWLHCFWGVGALTGPAIMSRMIATGASWRNGYMIVAVIQFALSGLLLVTLPLWKRVGAHSTAQAERPQELPPAPKGIWYPLRVPGVKFALVSFLFYCGAESTMGLWGSSYLISRGLSAAAAAGWVSGFFASITAGRFLAGVIASRVINRWMIRGGQLCLLAGVVLVLLPLPVVVACIGFLLIGLGCAPIFPAMLHETPTRFGKRDAQQIMGFQMAMAYCGATFLPPIFGWITQRVGMQILPWMLLLCGAIMLLGSEGINRFLSKKAVNDN